MRYALKPSRKLLMQRGFTLVELMVAMIIGLITTVVVGTVMSNSEIQNRMTNSANDALTSGNLALYTLERDISSTGLSFSNYSGTLGCSLSPSMGPSTIMAPIIISQGATRTADSITIMTASNSVMPVKSFEDPYFKSLQNHYWLASSDCSWGTGISLKNASKVPSDTTPYFYLGSYTAADKVSGIHQFKIDAAKGLVQLSFNPASNAIITGTGYADGNKILYPNIVQMKALYGKDTSATPDGTIDVWDAVTPANSSEWAQVRAVRVAVVARSAAMQTSDVTTQVNSDADVMCDISTVNCIGDGEVRVSGKRGMGPFYLASDSNWKKYHYRVFETVIPVRNLTFNQN